MAITGVALVASVALILHTLFLTIFTAGDLALFQRAAVRWLSGGDPYGVAPPLTPGGPPGSDYGYPLPALYFIVPLTPLPRAAAATLHSQLSLLAIIATPFAWLRRRRGNRTIALASLLYMPLLDTIAAGQWPAILLGIGGLSAFLLRRGADGQKDYGQFWSGFIAPLLFVKPQIGVVLYAALLIVHLPRLGQRWWLGQLAGWLVWWGGSLALDPAWPWRWQYQLGLFAASNHYQRTAMGPAGIVTQIGTVALALALVAALAAAWRQHDRLVAGAAIITLGMLIVPSGGIYDLLLLWLALTLLAPRFPRLTLVAAPASWAVVILLGTGVGVIAAEHIALFVPVTGMCLAGALRRSPKVQGRGWLPS